MVGDSFVPCQETQLPSTIAYIPSVVKNLFVSFERVLYATVLIKI